MYSLGAIYLTLQNLPRSLRYKSENIILVGVMPGPKESSLNINSYLSPLVLELQQAWSDGFVVMSSQHVPITVKLALSCVACDCDIPASRKIQVFWATMQPMDAINAQILSRLSLVNPQTILGLIVRSGSCNLDTFTDNRLKKF